MVIDVQALFIAFLSEHYQLSRWLVMFLFKYYWPSSNFIIQFHHFHHHFQKIFGIEFLFSCYFSHIFMFFSIPILSLNFFLILFIGFIFISFWILLGGSFFVFFCFVYRCCGTSFGIVRQKRNETAVCNELRRGGKRWWGNSRNMIHK